MQMTPHITVFDGCVVSVMECKAQSAERVRLKKFETILSSFVRLPPAKPTVSVHLAITHGAKNGI